ncbi:hypothetical protein TNCV_99391 [Trichonephila clavipes]|nr:hypothetical protein TNCV_99391 [Trichonephila clavipes]
MNFLQFNSYKTATWLTVAVAFVGFALLIAGATLTGIAYTEDLFYMQRSKLPSHLPRLASVEMCIDGQSDVHLLLECFFIINENE